MISDQLPVNSKKLPTSGTFPTGGGECGWGLMPVPSTHN
ncbi:hypothetical protein O53_4993 [Microcystis aeruginosa TAIHU98]|uniref:Uncharacterized protein n=1 Tax=Microcystis aeruginosa TAIHU98 TaxID=1134457 RepID=L7E0D7_MICAE|nr:hypothetical protein O53_4993 [Microcystis aeruginosa TAIHU98]